MFVQSCLWRVEFVFFSSSCCVFAKYYTMQCVKMEFCMMCRAYRHIRHTCSLAALDIFYFIIIIVIVIIVIMLQMLNSTSTSDNGQWQKNMRIINSEHQSLFNENIVQRRPKLNAWVCSEHNIVYFIQYACWWRKVYIA